MIERPAGGFSLVLVDGQGSGRGAKSLSNLIVTRAIAQLKDGARDGVVARGVHDYLYTYRLGQVAATLNIVSFDQRSASLLISRNNPAPFVVLDTNGVHMHSEPSAVIGLHLSLIHIYRIGGLRRVEEELLYRVRSQQVTDEAWRREVNQRLDRLDPPL